VVVVAIVVVAVVNGVAGVPQSYLHVNDKTQSLDPGTYEMTLRPPDTRLREYFLHVPRFYNSSVAMPLVFDNHGYTSNAEAQNRYTGYRSLADQRTFAVVHPEGVQNSWNAGQCCGYAQTQNIDDVLFFRMMVDEIASLITIDRTRVFTTGMSNGGFISHRLGMEASDVFNAIGPVAATAPYFMDEPERAVGVYHIHGTDDYLVPYDGNLYFRSVDESMEYWRDNNGCGPQKEVTDVPEFGTTCETFVNCPDRHLTICTHGGGHIVPDYTAEKTYDFFISQLPINATVPAVAGHSAVHATSVKDVEAAAERWTNSL